jgi:hypothetical protein
MTRATTAPTEWCSAEEPLAQGAERLAALVSHTHVVFNNMEDQGQPTARSLMDVMGILPPARRMAGVARGLNGAPWRSDP